MTVYFFTFFFLPRACLESGKVNLSLRKGKVSVSLECPSGKVELDCFALPATERKAEMKAVLFLLVRSQQRLHKQLQGTNVAMSSVV